MTRHPLSFLRYESFSVEQLSACRLHIVRQLRLIRASRQHLRHASMSHWLILMIRMHRALR